MIKLRQMAAAFLCRGEQVLMMKRAETRELAPGLWAPIGGHLEEGELNDPAAACLREICEETGIAAATIRNFRLKYLLLRRKVDEIRVQYIYFGETTQAELRDTIEGKLAWVERDELLGLELPAVSRFILEHYYGEGSQEDQVIVGTVGAKNGGPTISWTKLADWES